MASLLSRVEGLEEELRQAHTSNARLKERVAWFEKNQHSWLRNAPSEGSAGAFCSCNSFNSSVTVNGTVNQVDLAKLQVLRRNELHCLLHILLGAFSWGALHAYVSLCTNPNQ